MRWVYKNRVLAFIFNFISVWGALAGPLEDGNDAYKRRDYATAMRILRPLAIRGNGMAAATVGLMYQNNFGIPLDYVTADLWFNLAAQNGERFGAFLAVQIEKIMTSRERTKIKEIILNWTPVLPLKSIELQPEIWSCNLTAFKSAPVIKWEIANGRMIAAGAPTYFKLLQYDEKYIIGFLLLRDKKNQIITSYNIIERKSGNYLDMHTLGIPIFGEKDDTYFEPMINTGHCDLDGL
jgi:hypothetical protein